MYKYKSPTKETVCVIVDAYSTGKHLAPMFREKGYSCIHVTSSPLLIGQYSHKGDDFIASFVYKDSFDDLVENLNKYKIILCIPGSESGVELADTLSFHLALPNNGLAQSQARRNKYKMIEAVKNFGCKTAEHIESEDIVAIKNWIIEKQQSPIVLKPLASANGDNVFFCKDDDEIEFAFNSIVTSNNLFGQPNKKVLAETYTGGEEYIVNTVSWNGIHFVVEIWRIQRLTCTTIYDYAEIMHKSDPAFNVIKQYTFSVLNALDIKFGAGTTELKYTPTTGPVLIETSARLMSGAPINLSTDLFGYSQASILVESYLETDVFLNRCACEEYSPFKSARIVVMCSHQDGELVCDIDLYRFVEFKTLHSYNIYVSKGDHIYKTVNSLTAPGEIYFLSDSEDDILKDYKIFRQNEQNIYNEALRCEYLCTHTM